ncbi:MAG: thermonuclease family protein [Limisphaerales bacterium]
MFRILHRLYVAGLWLVWMLAAFAVYEQRALVAPLRELGELIWNQDRESSPPRTRLVGTVRSVYSGDGFQLKDDAGYLFNYGLAGVDAPKAEAALSPLDLQTARGSRSNLAALLVDRRVEIEVTRANPETRTGLGLVRAEGTNLNTLVLASGWAELRREQIRGLPLKEQFAMVLAEQSARRRGMGLWALNGRGQSAGSAAGSLTNKPAGDSSADGR